MPLTTNEYYEIAKQQVTRETARELTACGYIVHELCSPDHDCPSPGKVPHQRGWNVGEPKSREWIEARFQGGENLGVLLTSDFLIVDCDVHDDGRDGIAELAQLYAAHGMRPPTATLTTGSGGVHVWLRVPKGHLLACNRKLLPNVDTRTRGLDRKGEVQKSGQVAVPPSRHANGRLYEWSNDLPPAIADLPIAPDFILNALAWQPPAEVAASLGAGDVIPIKQDGWDIASHVYWQRACDTFAALPNGGGGLESRNTMMYRMGVTGRRLADNPNRTVPQRGAMFADAVTIARSVGLRDDLERQFSNGWNDGAGDPIPTRGRLSTPSGASISRVSDFIDVPADDAGNDGVTAERVDPDPPRVLAACSAGCPTADDCAWRGGKDECPLLAPAQA